MTDKIRSVYPAGTSVITEVDRQGTDPLAEEKTQVQKPSGQVGVILESPARHDGKYLVKFPDGRHLTYTHDQIKSRRRKLRQVIADKSHGREFYQQFVAYECVVGSTAYGLATESSDEDVRGFFIPPTEEYFGLPELTPPEQIEGAKDPETDKPLPGQDWVFWEVQKYVRQLLSANPSYLETLYTPHVLATSEAAERLRNIRQAFLSKQIGRTYSGYAISQMRRMEKHVDRHVRAWEKWRDRREEAVKQGKSIPPRPDVPEQRDPTDYRGKHAMHLMRLLYSGAHALRTGELMVEVPQEIREKLLNIRHDPPPIEDLRSRAQAFINEEFDPAMEATDLPEQPDFDTANAYLKWVRQQALELDPQNLEKRPPELRLRRRSHNLELDEYEPPSRSRPR